MKRLQLHMLCTCDSMTLLDSVRVIHAWVQQWYMFDTPPQSHVELRRDFAKHLSRARRGQADSHVNPRR